VGVLPESVAGGLAYFTFLPALFFLFVEPYRRNAFLRFHALQSFLITIAVILLALVLRLSGMALFVIPVLGPLLVVLVDVVVALAAVFVWFVLVVKAFRGETFKIPFLGDFAEHYAAVV
jgi:uncharacterized membrane protein